MDSSSFVSRWKSILVFLYVLFQLIFFYPYEIMPVFFPFWNISGVGFMLVFTSLNFIISSTATSKSKESLKQVFLLSFVQLIGFTLCFINSGQISAIGGKVILILYYCSLLYVLVSTTGLVYFFKLYNRWILLMAILGTITWVLCEFRGLSPLYFVPDPQEEDRFIYNYLLTFSVHDSDTFNMRYSGYFDEPGAMAQWGLFALLINKLTVKEKWIELPLILCLVFTFSMGFYIQLFAYYLLFYANRKNFVYGLFFLLLSLFLLYGLSLTEGGDFDFIYQRTFGRFSSMVEQGQQSGSYFAVDDRTDLAKLAYNEFLQNPIFGTTKTDLYVGDNIYEPLAMYGIVGTIFIYFPFLWLLRKSIKNRNVILRNVSIIILVGVLHRPFHTNVLWSFILYSIVLMSYYDTANKQIK